MSQDVAWHSYVLLLLITAFCTRTTYGQLPAWTRITDVPQVETVRFNSDGDILLTSWTSVFRSRDGGATWSELAAMPDGVEGLVDVLSSGGKIVVASVTGGVIVSDDGGDSWEVANSGLTNDARRVLAIAVLHDTLYAATDGSGVYRFDAHRSQWEAFNEGLGSNIAYTSNTMRSMHGVLHLGAGMNGHLYQRSSGDLEWSPIEIDPMFSSITALTFHSTRGHRFVGTNVGPYRSEEGGMSFLRQWQQMPPPRRLIAFTSAGERLFCLSVGLDQFAISFSPDEGESWQQIAAFPGYANDILLVDNRLLVAREDGLWYLDVGYLTATDPASPAAPMSLTVYPNPAHQLTRIELHNLEPGPASVRIYDPIGRLVQSHAVDAGTLSETVTLDVSILASGAYFVVVDSRSGPITRSLTVVR